MKKTSRIVSASLALLALFALSGCAEVTVNAAVIDNDSAVFVMEQRISPEGMKELPKQIAAGNFDIEEASEAENTSVPELFGTWTQDNPEGAGAQTLEIGSDTVKVTEADGTLIWLGSYDPPKFPSRVYDWISTPSPASQLKLKDQSLTFSLSNDKLFYVGTDELGQKTAVFFSRDGALTESEDEVSSLKELTSEEQTTEAICEYISNAFAQTLFLTEGTERVESCDEENGYSLTTTFPITYNYSGITAVGDHEISQAERRDLPVRFYVDSVYQDVVFEHDIIGLNNRNAIASAEEWTKVFSSYDVSISFPGEVTGFSNEGTQPTPESVNWNYDLIKTAVTNGDYTLSAAGRADYKVDPVPIILTAVGVLFLLVLVVYFMWKRFSPKVIIIVSYALALFGPFGVALAFVAKHKARNNADGAAKATVAVWVTSAIFIFELLVVFLLLILTPQLVTELLASMGLATSSA